MTILQRIVRSIKPSARLNSSFENYYSKLLNSSSADSGVPTAREAQQDLRAALDRQLFYL